MIWNAEKVNNLSKFEKIAYYSVKDDITSIALATITVIGIIIAFWVCPQHFFSSEWTWQAIWARMPLAFGITCFVLPPFFKICEFRERLDIIEDHVQMNEMDKKL